MNIFLKIIIIFLILGVCAWALQKLFPPTEKDVERTRAEEQRRLARYEELERERAERRQKAAGGRAARQTTDDAPAAAAENNSGSTPAGSGQNAER